MQLTVFRGGDELKVEATDENIISALQDTYLDKNEVVFLEDQSNECYMQTAGGWHIEYQANLTQYVAQKVSFTVALDLFQSFSKQNGRWKSAVNWEVDAEITANLQLQTSTVTTVTEDKEIVFADVTPDLFTRGDWLLTPLTENWAVDQLHTWSKKVATCRRKVKAKTSIGRWESNDLMDPVWGNSPGSGITHWRDCLEAEHRQEYDTLVPVATTVAEEMKALFMDQAIDELAMNVIGSISTMRSMLKDAREVDIFLTHTKREFPGLEQKFQRLKEKFAWYRARKKIDEAEIAEALGQEKKSEKLRIEAGVMLKQDWREVFSVEDVPDEVLGKVDELHRQHR